VKVRCVDAKEPGIPIREGEIYTVGKTFVGPEGCPGDGLRSGMDDVPGISLVEVPGYFRADRFEVVT
jgi:hypothetical protein